MKRIIIGCVGLGLLGLLGILILDWSMFGDQSSFQTGLGSYQGLPSTASDISIYQNKNISGLFVADFKIAEHDFVSFAAEKHWNLQPITDLPRFAFQAKAFHEHRQNDRKEVVDGLFYSKRAENNGGITVIYDRKDGRGFIESSSR